VRRLSRPIRAVILQALQVSSRIVERDWHNQFNKEALLDSQREFSLCRYPQFNYAESLMPFHNEVSAIELFLTCGTQRPWILPRILISVNMAASISSNEILRTKGGETE